MPDRRLPAVVPLVVAALVVSGLLLCSAAQGDDATALVRAAIDHWRGLSSYSEMTMTIHRPDWERRMSMRAWTKGDERTLVRVTAPARDRGNGTLLDGDDMWTYSPKINRVIKVPSSMMAQSWMGSDFSNKDVSRADDIVEQYRHSLLAREESGDHTVSVVAAVPREGAPVVWGREVLRIRDDYIVLEHRFYDQDGELVKALTTLDIAAMGGRTVARRQRMEKAEAPDEWTEIVLDEVEYGIELNDSLFTLSSLRNPRD